MLGASGTRRAAALAALLAAGAASAAPLVVNGGFERTDAAGAVVGWRPDGKAWTFDEEGGVDGSRALRWANGDPAYYAMPSQCPPLAAGRRYRLSVKVRCERLVGGKAGACLEWYGADGRWKGGVYPTEAAGTQREWLEMSALTPAIPTGMVRFLVQPLCTRGATGRAWFDDLRVEEVAPDDAYGLFSDRYRNRASSGRVTFKALLGEVPGPGRARASFAHRPHGGAYAPERTLSAPVTGLVCAATFDVADFAPGENEVRFTLRGADGRARIARDIVFSRVAPAEEAALKVRIDAHRRTLVDGRPFFPLGMYWSRVDAKLLDVYAQGPFNCLMPYHAPDRAALDLCQAKGLKVIYNAVNAFAGRYRGAARRPRMEEAVAHFARLIRRYRGHPALLAWYLNDELPLTLRDELATARCLAEELDPDHPTWVVIWQHEQVRDYLPTFDVVGTDPYPLFRNPIGMVTEWTRDTREGLMGLKPMWQVPQVFDKWAYEVNRRTPGICGAPSEAEVRNMAWQCLVGGANGLVFYSFFDLVAMDARTPFARRWAEVVRVAAEIKAHERFFLSTEAAPAVTGVPDGLVAAAWRFGGETLVAVVNTTRAPLRAEVQVAGGPFAVDLPPIGVSLKIVRDDR